MTKSKRTRSLTVKNWVISLTNTTENHYHHSQIFPVCVCQSGAWSGGSAAAVSRCSCPPIRRSAGSSPQSGSAPIYLLHLCWWSSNCTYKKYTNREKWNILNNVCFKKSMVPTSKFSSLTFHLIFCCCWWGVGKRGGRREGQREGGGDFLFHFLRNRNKNIPHSGTTILLSSGKINNIPISLIILCFKTFPFSPDNAGSHRKLDVTSGRWPIIPQLPGRHLRHVRVTGLVRGVILVFSTCTINHFLKSCHSFKVLS